MIIQLSLDPQERIKQIVNAAKEIFPQNMVLAKLAAAQAVHESRLMSKPSNLAINYNNLFGIKGTGTAGSISLPTWENINGKDIKINANFARNKTLADSFKQYKNYLETSGLKSLGKQRYEKVLKASTFLEAATNIKLAGYATDPKYTINLISIYNKYLKDLFS